MGRNLRILLLKKHFDKLVWLDEKIYFRLEKYLVEKRYQKGSIIKKANERELYARFINTGYIAKMWPSEKGRDFRLRVFGPGKVAADFESYFSGQPSNYGLKAITYTSTFELHHSLEKKLLKEVPEVAPLATCINSQILMESIQWHNIFSLSRNDGYSFLKNKFSDYLQFFSDKDLGYLFKCSEQHIKKIKEDAGY